MQQEYLDTSNYEISLHSIDSRFSDVKNNVNSEFRIVNPRVLKNVIRIRLASVEVPLVEPMFTKLKGNVSFNVRIGTATTYNLMGYLTDGNYTKASLIDAIQTRLRLINANFSVTLNDITGFVSITNSSTSFAIDFASPLDTIACRPTHWGLGYYLGFRDTFETAELSAGIYSVTGTSVINIDANPYYLVRLKCPEEIVNVTHRVVGGNFVSAFAKIILTNSYYQLQFDNNSNLVRNEYTFLSPVNVPHFQISLLDPWGELVNMMDVDWSYTVEVTEIKNRDVYNTLLTTYKKGR